MYKNVKKISVLFVVIIMILMCAFATVLFSTNSNSVANAEEGYYYSGVYYRSFEEAIDYYLLKDQLEKEAERAKLELEEKIRKEEDEDKRDELARKLLEKEEKEKINKLIKTCNIATTLIKALAMSQQTVDK